MGITWELTEMKNFRSNPQPSKSESEFSLTTEIYCLRTLELEAQDQGGSRLISSEASLLSLQMDMFMLCPHVVFPLCSGERVSCRTWFSLDCLPKAPAPDTVSLGVRA